MYRSKFERRARAIRARRLSAYKRVRRKPSVILITPTRPRVFRYYKSTVRITVYYRRAHVYRHVYYIHETDPVVDAHRSTGFVNVSTFFQTVASNLTVARSHEDLIDNPSLRPNPIRPGKSSACRAVGQRNDTAPLEIPPTRPHTRDSKSVPTANAIVFTYYYTRRFVKLIRY